MRYIYIQQIGQGGFGRVDLCKDFQGIQFAKKLLLNFASFDAKERFKREVKVIINLKHHGIVKIIDYDLIADQPYYIMPYYKNGSLRSYLKKYGKVNERQATWLVYLIAKALEYAHANNAIHRDLKPENILFDNKWNPIIADWGLGKFVHRNSLVLTAVGAGMGTPIYCAPEQWNEALIVDPRADIYSLGMIYRELITGNPDFGQANNSDINIVLKGMTAYNKENRYRSISEVINNLDIILNNYKIREQAELASRQSNNNDNDLLENILAGTGIILGAAVLISLFSGKK